jgi:hypothetical protein
LQEITELSIQIKKIGFASYTRESAVVTFHRFVLFQTIERIATDRLLVSDEAVRVLDRRE